MSGNDSLSAGCLQAEIHQVSAANAALAADNMQMKHELQQSVSQQKELALSRQVTLTPVTFSVFAAMLGYSWISCISEAACICEAADCKETPANVCILV